MFGLITMLLSTLGATGMGSMLKIVGGIFQSISEAKAAKEAFFTSATAIVKPVTSIDGDRIGKGVPGEITCKLIDLYFNHMHDTRDHYGH